jgi:hypothetical protein
MNQRVRKHRRRPIRSLFVGILLPMLVAGLLASPASAITYDNEQQLLNLPDGNARDTFIITGTQGRYLEHADLRAHPTYFQSLGYDLNFLTWAPVNPNFDPTNREWAGCLRRPDGSTGICPHMPSPGDYSAVRHLVAKGPIRAIEHGGSFIGLVCGNHPRQGAAGPRPTISGVKYEDVNGNGSRDSGEPGLQNWTIRLHFNGHQVAATQTSVDGSYSFPLDANSMSGSDGNPIGEGTYSVTEDQQSGWVASAAPGAVGVSFGDGNRQIGGMNFGNYRPASIAGTKVEDMDADGVGAGDPGLPDWKIDLTGHDRPSDSTVTGADGSYRFGSVRPGTYTISEVQKEGWFQSAPTSSTFQVTIRSGEALSGFDFGNYRLGSIAGRKFDDYAVDGSGEGDSGIAGWSITRSGGDPLTTAADGTYKFAGLVPGVYDVGEVQQDGWRQTAPASGAHEVRVRSGGDITEIDFGNVCLGSVEVTVEDVTGAQTGLGLEFRLEEIDVPGILTNDPALPLGGVDRTDFENLLPGKYRLIAFLPDGVFTADADATLVEGRWAIVKEIVVANCEQTDVDLEVFTASRGKVTGGVRFPVPDGFATSGFQFQSRRDGTPTGMLEFQDHVEDLNLHTDRIEGIMVEDARRNAWIWGTLVLREETVRFRLHLVDDGEPGVDDRFHLAMPGYEAGRNETLVKGNVQIHKPQ